MIKSRERKQLCSKKNTSPRFRDQEEKRLRPRKKQPSSKSFQSYSCSSRFLFHSDQNTKIYDLMTATFRAWYDTFRQNIQERHKSYIDHRILCYADDWS